MNVCVLQTGTGLKNKMHQAAEGLFMSLSVKTPSFLRCSAVMELREDTQDVSFPDISPSGVFPSVS